jgi:hypothetical protein
MSGASTAKKFDAEEYIQQNKPGGNLAREERLF